MRYTDIPSSDLLIEARKLHKQGNLGASLDCYSRALAEDPTSLDGALNHASVLLLTGPPSAARRALAAAEPLALSNARACRDLGFAWIVLGEWARAESAFARAVELDPSLVGAHLARSEALLELARTAEAIDVARAAVRFAPHEAAPRVMLHHALYADDRDAARAALDHAIGLDPSWAVPRFLRACDLATHGRIGEAEDLLRDSTIVDGLARVVRYASTLPKGFSTFTSRAGLLRHAVALTPQRTLALEFGVHHGASTRVLATELERARGEGSETPALFVFDSFRGLPEAWQGKAAGVFSTAGEPPPLPQSVEVQVGLFEDALPAFLNRQDGSVGFVHLDADIYSSTRTVLTHLEHRFVDGTVLVFDEYFGNASWEDDEFRAFREFIERSGLRYDHLAVNWLTGQAALRLSCGGGCPVSLR